MKVDQLLKKASSSITQIRTDPSMRLTLFLLLGVLGLGAISALIGFLFGHQSLKGVTQPDMNPFVSAASGQSQFPRQGNYLLKESDILAKVERETKGIVKTSETKKTTPTAAKKDGQKKDDSAAVANADKEEAKAAPIAVNSQGMQLSIRSLTVDDEGVTLDVTLQNGGANAVQFLYDFLDVSDDQSQFLSTEVKGLPAKFSPKSESFNGVIKVLGVSPESAKWISISLSDYPDQKVELKVPKLRLKK